MENNPYPVNGVRPHTVYGVALLSGNGNARWSPPTAKAYSGLVSNVPVVEVVGVKATVISGVFVTSEVLLVGFKV